MELAPRYRLHAYPPHNATRDADRLTVVSISRAGTIFSWRIISVLRVQRIYFYSLSSLPPPPRRSWRTYLCLCVYMYALTFRLRDFFIFAQSAYPSPFASEDAFSCPVLVPDRLSFAFFPALSPSLSLSLSLSLEYSLCTIRDHEQAKERNLRPTIGPLFHGLFRR